MPAAKAATASRDLTAELAFLTRALKAPTLRESVSRLAERARAESWSHEEYLAACLHARWQLVTRMAVRVASRPPDSQPARALRSSTSITPAA